ncbi:Transcription initiation factor IIE subunit alpha [Cyberlindnera fabianii]|uniref:Transcription initiation factor IIE subunit alpha n=1 Tax=Cyberlindnera fabianii TaxID=36022 RepID=A0A1V2L8J8_CYBFA|nr:Transcription initiation factor IIE subunit alpha [Cyberlindnera fabianii]
MDTIVRNLIRYVSRSFYEIQYVLILDALLLHSVLSEEDMCFLLGIQRKELRSFCNRLAEDRLVATHQQREGGIVGQRPQSKTYYFIHHTEAIDAIKWKVQAVVNKMQKELGGEANAQGYICPVCKTKYSQLDAIALLNYEMNEFICSLCNTTLIEDDSGKIAKENQEKYSRLMKQIEPIIDCLRKIDEHTVPENNFETSLGKLIPAQAKTTAQYIVSNYQKNTKMFDRNSYLNNRSSLQAGARSHATLHVDISTGDEDLQREKQAIEQEEKRKQNALPSWHEESTIGKSLGRLDGEEMDEEMEGADGAVKAEEGTESVPAEGSADAIVKAETEDVKPEGTEAAAPAVEEDKEAEEALAAYYAQLKKEKDEDDEEEEEFDDEIEFDDVDFEDVETETPAPAPAASVSPETAETNMLVEEIEFDVSDDD